MSKLFFISLFFFFSVQKVINAIFCRDNLTFAPLNNLSISNILSQHEHEKNVLGKWLHFLFTHFGNMEELGRYAEGLSLESLDVDDRPCFKRAVTVFLLHCGAKKIKQISSADPNYASHFHNMFGNSWEIFEDFVKTITYKGIIKLLDTIILNPEHATNLDKSYIYFKKFISFDKKKKKYALNVESAEKALMSNIEEFSNHYVSSGGKRVDVAVSLALRDYTLLAYLGSQPNYHNSDITQYTIPNPTFKEKKKRNLFFKRSSHFVLSTVGLRNDLLKIYNPCYYKKGKGDFGYMHDLVFVYTTIIQQKMVLGHQRFVRDFEKALIKRSYKVTGLKGTIFLKQLFRRNNFANLVKLYLHLVSREWDFLIDDILLQFDQTFKCEVENHPHKAGTNYYNFKTSSS